MISPLKSATPSTDLLARRFVIGIGLVSLFADFTYEGGHSILGPYLALLSAGPWLVGAVAGIGEFLGYAVRLLSGHYADRTRRHWSIMGVGYALKMRAGVASLTLPVSRATAYGIFDTTFGAAWMIGSIIMGRLYTLGPGWLVGFGVLMQALALPLLAGIPVIPTAKPA